MPDRAGPHQPLQCPDDEQHDQGDELDAQQVTREAVREKTIGGGAPVGHVVRRERDRDDPEHRPLGRHLHTEGDERLDDAQPRPRHPEEARRFTTETIRRERTCRLAIQVQAQPIQKRAPPAGRSRGELNPPCSGRAIHRQEQDREEVVQSEQSPRG